MEKMKNINLTPELAAELEKRNEQIKEMYLSKEILTQDIAKKFDISPKQVQRIMRKFGVVRTNKESNLIMADKKNYKNMRVPKHILEIRKDQSADVRKMYLNNFPQCNRCGIRRFKGVRLELLGTEVVCYNCIAKEYKVAKKK